MLELMNENFHVIGESGSIKEAKIALTHQFPDLVLLDIELKRCRLFNKNCSFFYQVINSFFNIKEDDIKRKNK